LLQFVNDQTPLPVAQRDHCICPWPTDKEKGPDSLGIRASAERD